jgi:hypothetical protein
VQNPDKNWHYAISQVQAKYNSEHSPKILPLGFHKQNQILSKHPSKTPEKLLLPSTKYSFPTSQLIPRTLIYSSQLVTFDQLNSIDDLIKHIYTLQLPNQLASVICNRYLQHYISLNPNSINKNERQRLTFVESYGLRISYYLYFVLMQEFMWKDSASSKMSALLESLSQFTMFTQVLQ